MLVNYTLNDLRGDDEDDSDADPDYAAADSEESDHSLYVGETQSSRKRRKIFRLAERK